MRPKSFIPAKYIREVFWVETPQFACTVKKPTGAKGKGLRYEAQVCEKLDKLPEWVGIQGPWFKFTDHRGSHRYAQPDWMGLNWERGIVLLVEIKLSRVPKAWYQLNELYSPLVRHVLGSWDIACLEIANKVTHFNLPKEVKMAHTFEHIKPGETRFMQVPYEP